MNENVAKPGLSGDGQSQAANTVATNPSTPSSVEKPAFVVGIGASAGGLEALERFFKAMPSDSGMAFVVLQHLSPDFKSLMDELLARYTSMTIKRVDEPADLRANTIYLLPPRKEMAVSEGKLVTTDRPAGHSLNMPINTFFRSLARELREKAIAIVLSGTGTDGTIGLMDVDECGGLVLVQSEETAKFDGMPRSAIDTGLAAAAMAPEEMPAVLLAYAKDPTAPFIDPRLRKADSETLAGLPAIIQKLRETYDLDFNYYKPATISRRIERRITLTKCQNIQEYSERLLASATEVDLLFKDLLIGVTRFFRDPEAFDSLRAKVILPLVDSTPANEEIRAWVPGCATGQEAYSLAMLFFEALEAKGREPNLKIFATDMHRESLAIASEGVYPATSMADLSEERRERFFHQEDSQSFRVNSRLRKALVFSAHNLIKDPPFTRVDLISCRNLLIYLQPAAQSKAMVVFHFGLKINGGLFLGPSEDPAELKTEFETLERSWKIYRKVSDTRLPMDPRPGGALSLGRNLQPPVPGDVRLARAYDVLLSRYVPTGVLINERREVLHLFGEADRFLRPQPGRMSHDVVVMARGDLRIALSSAIQAVLKKSEKVTFRSVRVDVDNSGILIDLTVEALVDRITGAKYLLILLLEERPLPQSNRQQEQLFEVGQEARTRIQQLESELQYTKESLQTTVEELQTSNEELQASNEELQASNQELQSTNEELHSVNEEIYSVNSELEQKNKELNETTTDLTNLMQASEIGTIFTDAQHRIRLFTPAAANIFNLLKQDVGRDIKHITSRIKDDDVLEDIGKAVATRESNIKKVVTEEGRAFLRRVTPYFDLNNEPVGLILTFVEITALDAAEKQFRIMFEGAPQAIVMVNSRGRITLVNRQAKSVFGYEKNEMLELGVEQLMPERYRTAHHVMREAFATAEQARPMGKERQLHALRKDGTEFPAEIGLSPIVVHNEKCVMAFITDTTERLGLQAEHQKMERKLQETARLESLGVLAGGIAHDFNNILAGILGNVGILEMEVPKDSSQYAICKNIEQASLRAAELCKQMLAYSGRGQFVLANVDAAWLVRDTLQLIRASVPKNVALDIEPTQKKFPVEVDVSQIRQVVMNLAINAAEAMGGKSGIVRIHMDTTRISSSEMVALAVVPPDNSGDFVLIEVADNGSGVSPENLKRIFDPFFTTKFTGRGLGLAAVQGIVRGHKGGLAVTSELGRGTTFRFFLPLSTVGPDAGKAEERQQRAVWKGSGKVLVVDDDDLVRTALSRSLNRHGFDTVTATNGREAIARFKEAPDTFALVVLDLTMPEMGGAETFAELKNLSPKVKVLLTSGYNETDATSRFGGLGLAGFLQKPFLASELDQAVRTIVEKQSK